MEPILHNRHSRRKRNSPRTNLIISVVFHVILFGFGAWWAANEGLLGKKMQELSVLLVPKEKKPDKVAEKKPEVKPDEPKKVEEVKTTQPKTTETVAKLPPPPAYIDTSTAPPPPPPVVDTGFTFGEETLNDPVEKYKGLIESTLLGRWNRPADVEDLGYVVEIEVSLDPQGKISGYAWQKGSGNKKWDDSVKQVLASVKGLPAAPPKKFPVKFTIRFDVTTEREETVTGLTGGP
jgi:TonB family protein